LLQALDTLSANLTPNDFRVSGTAELFSGKLGAYLLVWNELTLQLRAHNEDHALLCHRLKEYAQELLAQVPAVVAQYEERLSTLNGVRTDAENRIGCLRSTEADLRAKVADLEAEVGKLTENINGRSALEHGLREELTELTYKLDDQKAKADELLFHCGKQDEMIRSLNSQAAQKDSMIEGLNTQFVSQEDILQKYKSEEAGFRPRWTRTLAELNELTETHKEILAEIEELSARSETRDVATEPIPELAADARNRHDKGKSVKKSLTKFKTLGENEGSRSSLDSMQTSRRKGKLSGSPSIASELSCENAFALFAAPPQPLEDSVETPPPEVPAPEVPPEETPVVEVRNLPTDYLDNGLFDEHLDSSFGVMTYVDRLFPLPRIDGVPRASFRNQMMIGELKGLTWTLRQIVMICRNSFEVDSLTVSRTDFMDLLTDVLMKTGKSVAIVDKIQANLLKSLLHWHGQSLAVQFFWMFVTGEYAIPDFRFVNMLFSLCFEALYPPIDVFLDRPDLENDNDGFLINRNFFNKICKVMLRLDRFPDANLEKIFAAMKTRNEYTDLVPVWLFAREMIELFRICHFRFHQQIRNVFRIVGSEDLEHVSRDSFPEFVKIVNPDVRDAKIRDMWQTMVMFDSWSDRPTVPLKIFIKFCGEHPGMSRWIEELPFLETFDRVYQSFTPPMIRLLGFLRNQLLHYLPKLMEQLREDAREVLAPYLRRMRDGFLRCELSTCSMCYRYILQYIDLKMTEQNPFQVITNGVTNEDVAKMVNHVMMRETLASLLLQGPTVEETVTKKSPSAPTEESA
jgi:uncharacterized coiled-coil DUF342 family protein